MAQRNHAINESPAQIRAAIAQARADLGAHLSALWKSEPFNPGKSKMPAQAKAKRSAAKQEKSAVKSESAKKSDSAKAKKRTPKRAAEGVVATAGHVLDEMAAGAVVGAVKAASQAIDEKESKPRKAKHKPSTGEVLSEMGSEAAVGAIVGAAKSMMPEEEGKAKEKGSRKGSTAKRKG